jgi:hypothetical protein
LFYHDCLLEEVSIFYFGFSVNVRNKFFFTSEWGRKLVTNLGFFVIDSHG